MIRVTINDVAFSTHVVIINLIVLFQFAIYGKSEDFQVCNCNTRRCVVQCCYLFFHSITYPLLALVNLHIQ
ncbi:hypothetical protein RYX36_019674, partial [Vicia faba]